MLSWTLLIERGELRSSTHTRTAPRARGDQEPPVETIAQAARQSLGRPMAGPPATHTPPKGVPVPQTILDPTTHPIPQPLVEGSQAVLLTATILTEYNKNDNKEINNRF